MDPKDLKVGGRYNWQYQRERLIYLGKKGNWHRFALVEEPHEVWCEVLDHQIVDSFEVTKP